jgi:hypothetical protein
LIKPQVTNPPTACMDSIVIVCFLLGSGRSLCGQDGVRTIIEKAIQAQGGEKQVAKLRIMRIKVEGKIDLAPELKNLPFVIEDTWQMPGRYKTVVRIQLKKDMAHAHTLVIDGDKGWTMVNGKIGDPSKEELAEFRDQKQGEDLDRLGFLNDKGRELSMLDEIKIEGKPAVGVLVKTKGHRDVKLYFDKSSGLLVKRERRIAGDVGKEILQEVFFSDYQEKDGLKHYRKISALHDGKKFVEGTVTEIEFFKKLDPKVFAKP